MLVGNFCGRRFSIRYISRWMDNFWRVHIGYVPVIHGLSCGWLGFVFNNKEGELMIIC
jgi:hypothetical protein